MNQCKVNKLTSDSNEKVTTYAFLCIFSALEGLDHHEATSAAFTPERIEWVLSHRRAVTNNVIDSL